MLNKRQPSAVEICDICTTSLTLVFSNILIRRKPVNLTKTYLNPHQKSLF